MKNNFIRIIFLTIFLVFLGLYYSSSAGLIDYQAKHKTQLTDEQIKMFEEDVKNNVAIDIKKYTIDDKDKYNNGVSKTAMKISNSIGKAVDGVLKFVFGKLEDVMKE